MMMRRALSILLVVLLVLLAYMLGYAVLSLPNQANGLSAVVASQMDSSGVSHPVTAVLLNFRGYDTLLEIAVLLLALLGVWSFAMKDDAPVTPDIVAGPVLMALFRVLIPVMIVVAGYLLWVGGHAPGGAFQAGSVLAAAGVLALLCGQRFEGRFAELALRIGLVLGVAMFVAVAVAVMLGGAKLLQYPVEWAGGLILLIEAAAMLSIGITLVALFAGAKRSPGQQP